MTAPLDLARTRAALEAFDSSTSPDEEMAAENALGLAFALDTADRNDPETAARFVRCKAGQDFVRRLVARFP